MPIATAERATLGERREEMRRKLYSHGFNSFWTAFGVALWDALERLRKRRRRRDRHSTSKGMRRHVRRVKAGLA